MKAALLIFLFSLLVGLNDATLIRHKRNRKVIRHASFVPEEGRDFEDIKRHAVNKFDDDLDSDREMSDLNKNKLNEVIDKDFLDLSDPSDSELLSDYDEILDRSHSSIDHKRNANVKKDIRETPSQVVALQGWKAERKEMLQSAFGKIEKKQDEQKNFMAQKFMQTSLTEELLRDAREENNSATNETAINIPAPIKNETGILKPVVNTSDVDSNYSLFVKQQYVKALQLLQESVLQRAAYVHQVNSALLAEQQKKQDEEKDAATNGTQDDSSCQNVTLNDCRFEQVALLCKNMCAAWNQTVEADDSCNSPASNNSCCVLPFTYQGKIYRSCTTIHRNVSWCSLTRDYDADKLWGYCETCSTWTQWSVCSNVCGQGDAIRTRNCTSFDGVQKIHYQKIPCTGDCSSAVCDEWSKWSECSKPCGSGVQTRSRNCTLPGGYTQSYYEHQVCNTEECTTSPPSVTEPTGIPMMFVNAVTPQSRDENPKPEENNCLLAYVSFDSFQELYREVHDESEEHNDLSISYQGPKMYNGNFSCGYAAYFFRHASFLHFRDDLFRNSRSSNDLTISFWMKISEDTESMRSQNKTQTLFYLDKTGVNFGVYHVFVDAEGKISYFVEKLNRLNSESPENENVTVDGAKYIVATSEVGLKAEEWYHIGAVYNDAMSSIALTVNERTYIGGPIILSHHSTAKSNITSEDDSNDSDDDNLLRLQVSGTKMDSTTQFQGIGNSPSLDSQYIGLLDEVYIMKCALNDGEISSIANICRLREDSNCTSPLLGFCPNCPSCHHGINKFGDLDLVVPRLTRTPHTIA